MAHIDPTEHREYQLYQREQRGLDAHSRRLQSTLARYAYKQEKERNKETSDADALKMENDRLKKELADSKKSSLTEFKALYGEMVKSEKQEKNDGGWQK